MPTPPPVSPLKLILTALYLLLWPALIPFLAGDWRWPEGWIFGGWFIFVCASAIRWLYRNDPTLLAERYRKPGSGGQSRRDKITVSPTTPSSSPATTSIDAASAIACCRSSGEPNLGNTRERSAGASPARWSAQGPSADGSGAARRGRPVVRPSPAMS